VVEWTGPPDAEEPASVVTVVTDSSQTDNGDRAGESGSPTTRDLGGGFTPIAAYTGLDLGALALILGFSLGCGTAGDASASVSINRVVE
jgi:hypothetical protein